MASAARIGRPRSNPAVVAAEEAGSTGCRSCRCTHFRSAGALAPAAAGVPGRSRERLPCRSTTQGSESVQGRRRSIVVAVAAARAAARHSRRLPGRWPARAGPAALGPRSRYRWDRIGTVAPRQVHCLPTSAPSGTSHGRWGRSEADENEVDLLAFEALRKAGQAAARAGDLRRASARLTEASALWRGRPFADIPSRVIRDSHLPYLQEALLATLETRIEADLRLSPSRAADVIPELFRLTSQHPERERFRGQLMLALYRCGRQAEALAVFRAAEVQRRGTRRRAWPRADRAAPADARGRPGTA